MPTIITHSGSFHADESLAVYMLKLTYEFSGSDVVRTRDPAVISKGDIVVDVGGEYDPVRHRYDHHQREFKEVFSSAYDIKLSSAGLIYKHFGRQIIAKLLNWKENDPNTELLYLKVYKDFILAFDGIDNGVSAYPSDVKPKYRDSTSIASRVASLNPWWNQPSNDIDERFGRAVELTGTEFVEKVRYLGLSWLPARSLVEEALANRFDVDPSGLIILFDQFAPWKQHLHQLEEETNISEAHKPLYVLYPDESGKWRIQAVPKTPDSFESRKALPDPWRGLRDDILSNATGIPGCVFIHASGFIGGATTKEGVLSLAQKAIVFNA
ncbi:hypothetical protein HK096_004831 [Nowakowskiella sp. JEL0078]|nr:hypothetical protein HK096_004831 [Nowakowskiella sp. JEL0078]